MKDILDLKSDADYELRSADQIVATYEKENRLPTDEEKQSIREHQAKAASLLKEIEDVKEATRIADEIRKSREELRKPQARQVPPMQPVNDEGNSVTATRLEIGSIPRNLMCFKDAGEGSAKAAEDGFKFACYLADRFWKAPWAKRRMKEILHSDTRAQTESSNSAGGALVPGQYANYIIRLVEEYGVWLKESFVVPMTSDHMIIPRRVSGLTTYNVGENTAITESSAAFDNVTLTAKKLGVLATYSSELSEDAALSVVDLLTNEMALAAASKIDEVGFSGDGSNSDFGIQGLLGKVEALTSSYWAQYRLVPINTFAEFTSASLGTLQSRVAEFAKPNGKFYGSPQAIETGIGGVLQGMGGVTIAEASGSIPMRFNGYPCVKSHYLREESSGTVSDDLAMIFFGDLRKASTTGIRRQFEIAESRDRYFLEDQIALRGTLRFDINIHDLGGLSATGHTTKGPIAALLADAA